MKLYFYIKRFIYYRLLGKKSTNAKHVKYLNDLYYELEVLEELIFK